MKVQRVLKAGAVFQHKQPLMVLHTLVLKVQKPQLVQRRALEVYEVNKQKVTDRVEQP